MKTLIEILTLSCEFLHAKGITSSRRDVERLIAHVLGLKRLDLYLQYDRPIDDKELTLIREGIRRLSFHEPIQYIEGKVAFHNCIVSVSTCVLIPRPETELLVDMVVRYLSGKERTEMKILDLCSGSGCIGIALKKEYPELHVVLAEYSKDAIKVARQNAVDNNVVVEVVESNLLSGLSGRRFNCIISNPPYVSQAEYEILDKSVKLFEPKEALLAGSSGLEFYEAIAQSARDYLETDSALFLEIGALQNLAIRAIFERNGYANIISSKDFSDRDRFLTIFQ